VKIDSSPSRVTQTENSGAGVGTQTSIELLQVPWFVSPAHPNAAFVHVTILGTTAWVGMHPTSIGVTGPTVARQGPPSQSTAAIASFVVQPPSHALGGSKGTPASPASGGHIDDSLTVIAAGSAQVPDDGPH
jgi:hypothetical protein